jgi:lipoprotein NlpI
VDFRKALELDPGLTYIRFRIWMARSRLGQPDQATTELRTYLAGLPPGGAPDWPVLVGRFLADELGETDLLAGAEHLDPARKAGCACEADYYAGEKRLLAGDSAGAADCFNKAVASGRKDLQEYTSAQAELGFLKAGKN